MRRISNAEMKRIVSLTCKEICITGDRNKAITKMANAYRVDFWVLSRLVSTREDICKERKNRENIYFVAVILYDFRKSYNGHHLYESDLCVDEEWYKKNTRFRVVRAINEYKAINYLTQDNPLINQNGDYIWVKKLIPFKTQHEASIYANKIKWEDVRNCVLPKSLR